MKIENIKATVLHATYIATKDIDGVESTAPLAGMGVICLQVDAESRDDLKTWLKDWTRDNKQWRITPCAVSLKKWYKSKSLDQLALFWSLIKVMTLEAEGKHDAVLAQQYYHGLLNLYGPRVEARLPTGEVSEAIKTLSEMTTVEASTLIEGTFRELSAMGVHIEKSNSLKNYYLEWRSWRGRLKVDGLEATYESLQEYRGRVPFCEATLRHLDSGEGHLAHIVSRGASGESDETWNYLHLCAEVHIGLQHRKGWVEMLERYPHLMGKVNTARQWSGLPTIKKPEDLYDDLDTKDAEEAKEKTCQPSGSSSQTEK